MSPSPDMTRPGDIFVKLDIDRELIENFKAVRSIIVESNYYEQGCAGQMIEEFHMKEDILDETAKRKNSIDYRR